MNLPLSAVLALAASAQAYWLMGIGTSFPSRWAVLPV